MASGGRPSDGGSVRDGPTVALVVPHGFTARLFLRSSLLDELLERVGRVGIFAPPASLGPLQEELGRPRLDFFPLDLQERRRDVAASFVRQLLADWRLTPTREIREREEWRANPWRRLLWPLHRQLGAAARLRAGWYAWENRFLPDPSHAEAFRALRPDVLVTPTPGVLPSDIRLIRRARSEGVPTVAFVQGWDNLTSKAIIGARPDGLIVWNHRMRDEATTLHRFRPDDVAVTGAPHFDPYVTRVGWVGRTRFLESLGLDPTKKVVLYATSPRRYFEDSAHVVELLAEAREAGKLGAHVQVVVRLHPQVVAGQDAEDLGALERFRGRVHLDVPRGQTGLAADYTADGIRHLGQLLDASDVTINVASSFTIDACILDRPVVNVRFDQEPRPYLSSVRRQYDTSHYGGVLETGAVRLADSPSMLIDEVRRYLRDPSLERVSRSHLVRELCYRVDGKAGARVATRIARIAQDAAPGRRAAARAATPETTDETTARVGAGR